MVDIMELLEKGKLILFVIFIMPGFISMKIYKIFYPSSDIETSKVIIDIVSYSCINYALLLIPIYWMEKENIFNSHPVLYYLFYVFVLIIVPVFLPVSLRFLRHAHFIRKYLPHPDNRPWDHFFSNNPTCWVLVTLKNGKKYGGRYGFSSFASGSPEPEQLYLEEHWALDDNGDFDHQLKDTLGILILTNEIESVEFIKLHIIDNQK